MAKLAEIEPLKQQVATLKQNTHLLKESNAKIHDLSDELARMRESYDKLKAEKETVCKSNSSLEKEIGQLKAKSSNEIISLRDQLEESKQKFVELQARFDETKSQISELENERMTHQNLIKEHGKLEQRFEKVRTELIKLKKTTTPTTNGQQQQHINNELESLIEEIESDKDQANTNIDKAVANFEANKLLYMTANGSEMDITLIGKLQRRIASLELERKAATMRESDNNNNTSSEVMIPCDIPSNLVIERLSIERDAELIKSQEFEFENLKLREDLSRLRDLVADNQIGKSDSLINQEMMSQFDAMSEEVQRRRDECIQLKSLLVARYRSETGGASDSSSTDISSINTDGNEYEVGFNTQKILNRMLENQMTSLQRKYEGEKEELVKEIKSLRDETSRQQEIMIKNLSPEMLAEATYKNEIVKLADQNLELSEKCDNYQEEIKKYKKMLKVLIKRGKTSNLYTIQF